MDKGVEARALARLEQLQRLTAALSRAVTVDDVTDLILTTVTEELGAAAALVALVDDDGESFEIVRSVGYASSTLDRWRTFPVEAPLPAGEAVRERKMIVLESLQERDRRYPALAGSPVPHEAFAVIPLLLDEGAPLGVVSFGFERATGFGEADHAFAQALGDQCAQAIGRARLYDEQRAVARRRGFVNEAGRLFARARGHDQLLQAVADLAARDLADGSVLYLRRPGGLSSVAVAHIDSAKARVLRRLSRRHAFSTNPYAHEVLSAGQSRCVQLDEVALSRIAEDQEHRELLEKLGGRAALLVPLAARDRVMGVLVLLDGAVLTSPRSVQPLAETFASLAALHIDNARLLEEQTRIAHRFQESLLPPWLPEIPGFDVGASYAAAGSGAEVGGDFYDVFEVPGGRWFLVTGDVRGRGADAAATTGLARHTIKAAAMSGESPSEVVRRLNTVLLARHDRQSADLEPRFCAVCVVAVPPSGGGAELIVCCAGHPLPRVLSHDGLVLEAGVPGTVAGVVENASLSDARVSLGPDDRLVLFTDGISERRADGEFFEDRLPSVLAGGRDLDAQGLARRLRDQAVAFAGGTADDDMAVLVLHRQAEPEGALVVSPPTDEGTVGRRGREDVAEGQGGMQSRRYRVVVADDDEDVRELARRYLERSGRFSVVAEATDGQEAVDAASAHHPDVTLLDLVMPDTDGLEALPRIRAAAPDTTVVVVSGMRERHVEEDALAAGAAGFLPKQPSWDRFVSDLLGLLDEVELGEAPFRRQLHLPGERTSGHVARRFLRDALRSWGVPQLLEDAELLASELINNAVLHATSTVLLHVVLDRHRLRVEVTDTGAGALHLRQAEITDDSGRGLFLVDALSRTWGTSAGGRGKTVWFELEVQSEQV